jgi:hypothetical protein
VRDSWIFAAVGHRCLSGAETAVCHSRECRDGCATAGGAGAARRWPYRFAAPDASQAGAPTTAVPVRVTRYVTVAPLQKTNSSVTGAPSVTSAKNSGVSLIAPAG